MATAAKIEIMAITTINSTRVKAPRAFSSGPRTGMAMFFFIFILSVLFNRDILAPKTGFFRRGLSQGWPFFFKFSAESAAIARLASAGRRPIHAAARQRGRQHERFGVQARARLRGAGDDAGRVIGNRRYIFGRRRA